MPAIREIVRERCGQIEAEEETVRIEAVFRTEWELDEDGLECVGRIPQTGGIPLCTGVRYLASLRSGNARISAIADVHIAEDAGEPPIEQVRSFLRMRLSAPGGGRWDPEAQSFLQVGVDIVRYCLNERSKQSDEVTSGC